ncbi:MAG: hypothetical protein ABI672_03640 [Vicinamibacteria bacterium]
MSDRKKESGRTSFRAWANAWRSGAPRDLNTILHLGLDAQGRGAPEQLDWLRSLVRWLRGQRGYRFTPEARAHLLLQRLNQHHDWSQAAGVIITQVLARGSALRIYCEAGLPSNSSFGKELMGRLVRSILPPVQVKGSLAGALQHVFAQTGDDVWLDRIPVNEREALIGWLKSSVPNDRRDALLQEAAEAIWLLSNRIASIALRDEVQVRSPRIGPLATHPMILLEDQARAFAGAVASGHQPDLAGLTRTIELGRLFLDGVLAQVEERGVSIDLVFQIERATAYVARIETLANMIVTVVRPDAPEAARSQVVWSLLVDLVRGELDDRRPDKVLSQSLHLIARKTVERAGETGEEGIAHSNRDLQHILASAIGGGLFVAVAVLVKYVEPKGLPPFFEALYAAVTYGGSFTAMHFLHLKLATKMPAMTASTLASRLTGPATSEDGGEFASTAIAILRTQLAAVVGNVAGVIPAALLIDWAVTAVTGAHLLNSDKAAHIIESVSPWSSLAIPLAMFTGVILWVGGWAASWIDNAFAFYGVANALASDGGLRQRLGEGRVRAIADFLSDHVGGVAAALVLGFSLAFVPAIGRLFGLPLEVRHITFVTGGLALAVASQGLYAIDEMQWTTMAMGVAVIGLCNLGVCFALAFAMALRARGLSAQRGVALLWPTAIAFLRRPRSLFRVPAETSLTQGLPTPSTHRTKIP